MELLNTTTDYIMLLNCELNESNYFLTIYYILLLLLLEPYLIFLILTDLMQVFFT